jgi:hypothetical protein
VLFVGGRIASSADVMRRQAALQKVCPFGEFAECKWHNEPAGEDVLQKLVHRSELFRRQHKSYVIFSKRGFTQGCQEAAANRGDTKLISFAEMCERR